MNALATQQKILIVHQGAVGDLILSLPSLYALRCAFPGHHVEVMGYPAILSLIHKRFYADAISSIDRASVAALYREQPAAGSEICSYLQQFEQIFIFGGPSQSCFVGNIRHISGAAVYHIAVFPESEEHVTDFQLKNLEAIGLAANNRIPKIFLLPADHKSARDFLRSREIAPGRTPLAAIHPGSGGKKKLWPPEHVISLVTRLYERFKGGILIIEGPADREIVGSIIEDLSSVPYTLISSSSLPLLAGIIQASCVYVGNDSGITHLAAALGLPALGVFGPTEPAIWGPRGPRVRILRNEDQKGQWTWPSPDTVFCETCALLGRQHHRAALPEPDKQ